MKRSVIPHEFTPADLEKIVRGTVVRKTGMRFLPYARIIMVPYEEIGVVFKNSSYFQHLNHLGIIMARYDTDWKHLQYLSVMREEKCVTITPRRLHSDGNNVIWYMG